MTDRTVGPHEHPSTDGDRAAFPAPSYEPLPVNPELIEEVRIGINLLLWLT